MQSSPQPKLILIAIMAAYAIPQAALAEDEKKITH